MPEPKSEYADLIARLRATDGKGQGGPAKALAADAIESLERQLAEVTETWTDDRGVVWTVPTSYAYAIACKAFDALRVRLEVTDEKIHTVMIAIARISGGHTTGNEARFAIEAFLKDAK